MTRVYGADLSFIHDAGFTGFARRAAPGLLASLRRAGIARGRVFDALLPASRPAVARGWSEGKGWAVLVETRCASPAALTRRIVTYRRTRKGYRRGEEVHRLRLYPAATLAAWLARAGFHVRSARGYGRYRLSRDRIVFIARRA